MPLQAPVQPVNSLWPSGSAVSVRRAPLWTSARQRPLFAPLMRVQLIVLPATTAPSPVPLKFKVRLLGRSKNTDTVWPDPLIKSVQVAPVVLAHSPPQRRKACCAAGVAVRVISVPPVNSATQAPRPAVPCKLQDRPAGEETTSPLPTPTPLTDTAVGASNRAIAVRDAVMIKRQLLPGEPAQSPVHRVKLLCPLLTAVRVTMAPSMNVPVQLPIVVPFCATQVRLPWSTVTTPAPVPAAEIVRTRRARNTTPTVRGRSVAMVQTVPGVPEQSPAHPASSVPVPGAAVSPT